MKSIAILSKGVWMTGRGTNGARTDGQPDILFHVSYIQQYLYTSLVPEGQKNWPLISHPDMDVGESENLHPVLL